MVSVCSWVRTPCLPQSGMPRVVPLKMMADKPNRSLGQGLVGGQRRAGGAFAQRAVAAGAALEVGLLGPGKFLVGERRCVT